MAKRSMYNLSQFKYEKRLAALTATNDDCLEEIPDTPPKCEQENKESSQEIMESAQKKRKYNLSSDEEDFVKQKSKKTRITHFLTKIKDSRVDKHNFISPDSGSDSDDNDQNSNESRDASDDRMSTLKRIFPEFSYETLECVCGITFTVAGAIAVLCQWKSEDIKNMVQRNANECYSNSQESADSPIRPKKRNCMRIESAEKESKADFHYSEKTSAKRLGLSSSESESDEESNSNSGLKGPFPRLSCVVKNGLAEQPPSADENNEVESANGNNCDNSKIEKMTNGTSPKLKKDKTAKSSHKKSSKVVKSFENETLSMDNAMDENFSTGEDGYGSSDDELSSLGEKRRKAILEFFKNAGTDELGTMQYCSKKKAKIITELRPFKSWNHLVKQLCETKHLGVDIISHCAALLKQRAMLEKLLEQCRSISDTLASEIEKLHCHDHMTEGSALMKAPSTIPSHLKLKPYQLVGLNWIALLHRSKVNGVLADEMGLGKTVQTIAFLAYLFEKDRNTGPHLVVVPTSTIDNWCREFSLWCPDLDVAVYRGSQSERRSIRVAFLRGRTANVIVTTYSTAISTPEDRAFFRKFEMHYAVFDEGHMLKNMSSQRYLNLMKFKTARKLLLTGTPLQNNLLELMSLLRFVMPHMFEQTTDTLIRIFSSSSSENQSTFAKDRIRDAKDIMQPFVLRRLKLEVLKQLPEKNDDILSCEMPSDQSQLYEETKERFRLNLNKKSQFEMKSAFCELRKVANHPLLRRQNYTADMLVTMAKLLKQEPEYRDSMEHLIVEDMTVMTDFELHCFCETTGAIRKFALDISKVLNSGKFQALDKLLPSFKEKGCRVVIFSQFTMLMDILEKYLKARNHKFVRLDGKTPANARLDLIDQYENDPSILVFLSSTKSGGLGINLTAANVVIIHDIDLNPYNDKQAEDRCHRLGQTKDVKIIRLISKDTIEEGMLQVAEKKLKLEQEMTTNQDESSDIAALLQKTLVK